MYVIQRCSIQKGLPKRTKSLCPECKEIIDAEIYENDGKIWYKKVCKVHGEYKDVYYGDAEIWKWMEKWGLLVDGVGVENPAIAKNENDIECPFDCGLCKIHYSHTALANIDLTNRCNLNCPVCFANANAVGYVYEPDFETVVEMLKTLREERPVPTLAVQFAGGEPTLHPNFFEIVNKARELGFSQVQVATNGILIAKDPSFAQKMLDAGVHTVYLQFDGFKDSTYIKERGFNILPLKLKAIENLRSTKPKPLATVLVPTIAKGVNDDEVGKILNFGLENIDVIRGVNYQPISLAGRIPEGERLKMRYTTGDLIRDLCEQTDYLEKTDFYPVQVAAIFSEIASQIFREPKIAFTPHVGCGAATYLFKDHQKNKVIPLTRFLDVSGILEEIFDKVLEDKFSGNKFISILRLYRIVKKHYDESKAPSGFKLDMLIDIFREGKKESLGKLHWDSMFVGIMHFQDEYNYDIERVKRCCVHYVTPDKRIIPFCAYNAGPTYRNEIERKFSIPIEEYKKKYGGVCSNDKD